MWAPLRVAPPKLNQMHMIRTGPNNAPILMLHSPQHGVIQGRKARSVSVQVPDNPAHYLHVYLMVVEALNGVARGVYKFRTQHFNETLLILYANVGVDTVTLTIDEVIAVSKYVFSWD